MAWLGEGLSSLRGQISNVANFTKEVLSDGRDEDLSDISGLAAAQRNIRELEENCASKDLEISNLRRQIEVLEETTQGVAGVGSQDIAVQSDHGTPESAWGHVASPGFVLVPAENEVALMRRVDHLEAENKLVRRTCLEYEERVAELLERQVKSASTTSEESDQRDHDGDRLNAADLRVMELEAELQRVQLQLLGHLGDTQAQAGAIRHDVEQARRNMGDTAEARVRAVRERQDAANAMQQLGEKRREVEASLQKLKQEQKHLSTDIAAIIQRLGDTEQQEFIHGVLNALELENQVLKLRNAELEMVAGSVAGIDMDVGYKRNHFNGEDELTDDFPMNMTTHNVRQSRPGSASDGEMQRDVADWLVEKEEIQKRVVDLEEQLKQAVAVQTTSLKGDDDVGELEELRSAKQYLVAELESMAALVQNLESKTASLEEENATLATSLEELDQQHQAVIDQLLGTKKMVQKENSNLQLEVASLKEKLEQTSFELNEAAVQKVVSKETGTETIVLSTDDKEKLKDAIREECQKVFEEESYANIMKIVSFDLPKEYYNKEKYAVNSMNLVNELVKMCNESKWKKETLERKVPELMKQAQDSQKIIKEREDMVARLERETGELRGNVESLIEQLMTSKNSSSEGLAVIPENTEEVHDLEQRIAVLEDQIQSVTSEKDMLVGEVNRLKHESIVLAEKLKEAESHEIELKQSAKNEADRINEDLKFSAEARSDREDLQRECSRLQGILKESEERFNEEIKRQADEIEMLGEKLQNCAESQKDAQDYANELEMSTKMDLDDIQQKYKLQIKELEEKCEMSDKLLADTREVTKLEMEVRTKELAQFEVVVKNLREEIHTLNNSLLASKGIEDECKELKSRLSNLVRETDSKCTDLERQVKEALDAKASVEEECGRLKGLEAELGDQSAIAHEVDKWRSMATATERQLDEALRARAELENECARLFSIETKVHNQEHLEREVARLTEISKITEQRLGDALESKELLENNLNQLKACLEDQKNLEQEATEWRETSITTERQLQDVLGTNVQLATDLSKLKEVESESAQFRGMVEVLQFKLTSASSTNAELETQLETSHAQLQRLLRVDEEMAEWKEKVRVVQAQLDEAITKKLEVEKAYKKMEEMIHSSGVEKSDQEKPHADDDNNIRRDNSLVGSSSNSREMNVQLENLQAERNRAVHILEEKTREIEALKLENNRLTQVMSEEKRTRSKLDEEKNETLQQQQFQTSEASNMAKETIANLSKIIKDKDFEIEALSQKCDTLVSVVQATNSNQAIEGIKSERETLLKEVSRLGGERDELIRTVQVKHNESLQYHCEIQRLSGLLNQELGKSEQIRQQHSGLVQQYEDKQKMLTNAQNELIAVKRRLDHLERLAGKARDDSAGDPESVAAQDEVIRMKTELAKELGVELKLREKENELLKMEIGELRGGGHEQMATGSHGLVQELQAERARLLDSLQQETTRNKYLQNEVQEQHEKESSLLRELERLRIHLVTVEDSFTVETLAMEEQMKELQAKLTTAEDRIKNCSTAYTSANIRANQHVESLQGQAKLMGQQRDDVQSKLSAAEDLVQHHAAALTNLQAVLEQFQRDKERDILVATGKLQRHLQVVEGRNDELAAETSLLKQQLAEATEGLNAAARLTEQLDKKTQVIAALKEEVQRLNEQLNSSEMREKSASQSSEGKVDRYLVKNLLIGYLVSPEHTKMQALRIVATVLDFNHDERSRVGLEPGAPRAGWFNSLMHPTSGPNNNQSLAEAFVKFLESESRPQPQLRLLPSIQEAPQPQSSTPKDSSAISGTRSPLLLSEVQLPTFTQFPVARSSSSILKDVLRDS